MMFHAPSQRHFELVFDFSYTLVVECCEVWLNSCFGKCGCTWSHNQRVDSIFYVLSKFAHSDYYLVVFLRIWSFHVISLCFLFLSYFSVKRVILAVIDNNVFHWWCVFFFAEARWAKTQSKSEIPSRTIVEGNIVVGDISCLVAETK